MVMNAEELRATGTGNWLAQLKKILQLGADDQRDYGNNPKSEHRSTKAAVKVLLSNLRKGTSKTPDGNTTDDDKKKIVFNAIDQLIRDKVSKSKHQKTKLDALEKFGDVLKQEFAAKANKADAVGDNWQTMMLEAVQALRVEEFDASIQNKDQDALEKILENKNNDQPRELRERCVKKMLASDDGKKELAAKTHVSVHAVGAVQDPEMFVDFLTWLNPLALSNNQSVSFIKALGNDKDEILAKAMLATSKKTLPTDNTWDKAANSQAKGFAEMAKSLDPAAFTKLATTMLNSKAGIKALVDNPKLGGAMLSSIDPSALKDFDFDKAFGPAKDDVLAEAVVMLSVKEPSSDDDNGKPPARLDPKLFKLLATKIDPKVWNDKAATTGARKGLGARVGMELWNAGGYQQISDMIKHGVDTSLPTRLVGGENEKKEGVYSGFVEPMQHIVSKYLREVGKLEEDENSLQGAAKEKAEGAKKIFAALEAKQKEDKKKNVETTVKTLTKWSDLKDWSEEFEENPGTIWGFEHVRMPYVQAGHESKKGSRPLRMWELWDALGPDPTTYSELLQDPKGFTKKKVEEAAKTIASGKSTRVDYADIKDLNAFVEQFKKDATAVLLEFAAQMPKGTFADVSKSAGFEGGKFLGALACKAGLWWAKEQKEPVYYCLDGINMDDVTNYKKLKSAAIDDFLSGRSKKKHDEVITMVELREVLKNWEDLKFKNDKDNDEDVVKFVLKGKILSGDELKDKVKKWQEDMEKINKAHPTPAPDFTTFTNELNKINTGLLAKLGNEKDAKKANQDGREIVKKYGYLVKIANTKPHIALKYIMLKCETLSDYGLISEDLPAVATELKSAIEEEDDKKIKAAAKLVQSEIDKCHKDFQAPLKSALLGRLSV